MKALLGFCALTLVCAGAVSAAELRLVLDKHPIAAGQGIGGYLELCADSRGPLEIFDAISVNGGGLAFMVAVPTGETIEISRYTNDVSYTLARGKRVLAAGECVRIPIFLFSWKGEFVFGEPGNYAVTARIKTFEGAEVLEAKGTLRVGDRALGFDAWSEYALTRYPSLAWPFGSPNCDYDCAMRHNLGAPSPYIDELEYFMSYSGGGIVVPYLLRHAVSHGTARLEASVGPNVDAILSRSIKLAADATAAKEVWSAAEAQWKNLKQGVPASSAGNGDVVWWME